LPDALPKAEDDPKREEAEQHRSKRFRDAKGKGRQQWRQNLSDFFL